MYLVLQRKLRASNIPLVRVIASILWILTYSCHYLYYSDNNKKRSIDSMINTQYIFSYPIHLQLLTQCMYYDKCSSPCNILLQVHEVYIEYVAPCNILAMVLAQETRHE